MSQSPLRIGFVDYQLENFHANVFLKAYRQDLPETHAVVAGCWGMDPEVGQAWARANDVPWYDSVRKLASQVDAFMILAPSNPEHHWPLVKKVASFGKPIYLDKPSAPDARTLGRIFNYADKHDVSLQTTSALRYTAVQQKAAELQGQQGEPVRHIVTWGGGRSFEEYGIHPVEMAVSCLGGEVQGLSRRTHGNFWQLLVNFSQERTATINVSIDSQTAFAATLVTDKRTLHIAPDTSRLFIDAAAAIAAFLRSGTPNIPREESLAVRRILDAAGKAASLNKTVRFAP